MDKRPKLSIVTVTHRTRDMTLDCLRSLYEGGGLKGLPDTEVIVVDNASGDGTVEAIAAEFPQVTLIPLEENGGLAIATNIGSGRARGEIILQLNADTRVPEGVLARCVTFLDSRDANTGAMTCRVNSEDGTIQWTCARRLITPWSEICRALLLDKIFAQIDLFNREEMVGWNRSDTRAVECVLGCFVMIRAEAFKRIGGWDERFFLMYEDVDWCKRCGDAGYTIWYWPDQHIIHLGGGSWKQDRITTYAMSHISALQYFAKHYPAAVGPVRTLSLWGVNLRIGLLKLQDMRKGGDALTLRRLEQARAARYALRTGRLENRPYNAAQGPEFTQSTP